MVRSHVQTYRYRVGKRTIIVVKIVQTARASAMQGNVLASNAANIQIIKRPKRKRR